MRLERVVEMKTILGVGGEFMLSKNNFPFAKFVFQVEIETNKALSSTLETQVEKKNIVREA